MNRMTDELVTVAADLYDFVEQTEDVTIARSDRDRALDLGERLAAACPDADGELTAAVDAAVTALHRVNAERDTWRALSHSYEALSAALRRRGRVATGAPLGRIKPRNIKRNLFHVHNGVIGVLLYELGVGRWTMVGIATVILIGCVVADIARRWVPRWNRSYTDGAFVWLTRPADAHETPSSTWFISALLIGTALYPQHGIELGVLVLAFADPAAAVAGKAWGRTKLYRDRTVVGTAVFTITAFATALVFLIWARPAAALPHLAIVAAVSALVGGIAELFADRGVDDNFSIPLLCGGVASLLL